MKWISSILIFLVLVIGVYAACSWCPDILPPSGTVTDTTQEESPEITNIVTGDLGINIDIKDSSLKPGEKLEIDVEVENALEEDLKDVQVEIEVKGLEDNRGNDIEDDDEFDIRKGRDKKARFRFTVGYDVDDGDDFDVVVKVKGKGKDTGNEYTAEGEESISISKERHSLLLEDVKIKPKSVQCSGRAEVEYTLTNIGREDEDVEIRLRNDDLGLNIRKDIELDEKDSITDSIGFDVDDIEGLHVIEFTAEYSKEEESEEVELRIDGCESGEVEVKQNVASKTSTEERKEVVELEKERRNIVECEEESAPVNVVFAKTVERDESSSFRDSDEYMFILIILSILVLGAVIFLIGALVIKSSKR